MLRQRLSLRCAVRNSTFLTCLQQAVSIFNIEVSTCNLAFLLPCILPTLRLCVNQFTCCLDCNSMAIQLSYSETSPLIIQIIRNYIDIYRQPAGHSNTFFSVIPFFKSFYYSIFSNTCV